MCSFIEMKSEIRRAVVFSETAVGQLCLWKEKEAVSLTMKADAFAD